MSSCSCEPCVLATARILFRLLQCIKLFLGLLIFGFASYSGIRYGAQYGGFTVAAVVVAVLVLGDAALAFSGQWDTSHCFLSLHSLFLSLLLGGEFSLSLLYIVVPDKETILRAVPPEIHALVTGSVVNFFIVVGVIAGCHLVDIALLHYLYDRMIVLGGESDGGRAGRGRRSKRDDEEDRESDASGADHCDDNHSIMVGESEGKNHRHEDEERGSVYNGDDSHAPLLGGPSSSPGAQSRHSSQDSSSVYDQRKTRSEG